MFLLFFSWFFGNLYDFYILVILFVINLIFGGKKLPELARGLGLGLKEFKKAKEEIKDEVKSAAEEMEEVEKDIKE